VFVDYLKPQKFGQVHDFRCIGGFFVLLPCQLAAGAILPLSKPSLEITTENKSSFASMLSIKHVTTLKKWLFRNV